MGMEQQKCYANAEAKIDEKVSHRLQLAVNEMRSAFLPICTPSFTSLYFPLSLSLSLSLFYTHSISISVYLFLWGMQQLNLVLWQATLLALLNGSFINQYT